MNFPVNHLVKIAKTTNKIDISIKVPDDHQVQCMLIHNRFSQIEGILSLKGERRENLIKKGIKRRPPRRNIHLICSPRTPESSQSHPTQAEYKNH
jgi:hypothetical protein